jgi:hypothetical protein
MCVTGPIVTYYHNMKTQPQTQTTPTAVHACPLCGGKLQATAKVYLDIVQATVIPGSVVIIEDAQFSHLNDSLDGHPVAIALQEVLVECGDCDAEFDHDLGEGIRSRIGAKR